MLPRMTRQQIEVFAAGLYHLSACDGVDEREIAIVHEFVRDAGAPELAERLDTLPFDPATAYTLLETSWLRTLFLRSAVLLIRADGTISDEERDTLAWMAMAFGVQGGLEAVEAQVSGEGLA